MQLLTALAIAAVMFASSAFAADPDDLQKLKNTGNCINCDLRNADLRLTDLSDASLESANLYGAILNRANIRNANIDGVLFCDTIMPDGSISLTNAMIYSGC